MARLIRSGVGLQVAVTDMGGWDTHVGEGTEKGQLASRLAELGGALGAFARDLGGRWADTRVVVMTEFGRTASENGNRGTDHGTASVMLVLGGGVRGGRVVGGYRGLARSELFEERDLAIGTDVRSVLWEAVRAQLALRDALDGVPGIHSRAHRCSADAQTARRRPAKPDQQQHDDGADDGPEEARGPQIHQVPVAAEERAEQARPRSCPRCPAAWWRGRPSTAAPARRPAR